MGCLAMATWGVLGVFSQHQPRQQGPGLCGGTRYYVQPRVTLGAPVPAPSPSFALRPLLPHILSLSL